MAFCFSVFCFIFYIYSFGNQNDFQMPPNLDAREPAVTGGSGSNSASTSAGVQQLNPTPQQLAAAGDVNMQQQMIEAFCRDSSMKPEWSRKCLEDQNWDYSVSAMHQVI